MTIAAGFCTDKGILLCADSQYTGGAKVNQQKLFGYTILQPGFDTINVTFALAGHEIYGKMAIENCVDALQSCKPKELTLRKARHLLRTAVKDIHEQYVDTRPDPVEKDNARFELVIGCWLPQGGGLKLFRTNGPGVVSGGDYYCVGIGAYLGDYLMRNVFNRSMSIREVALLAIQALAAAKAYDANCGGESQFLVIHSDGELGSLIEYNNIQQVETYIADFEKLTRTLLFNLADFSLGLRELASTSDQKFEEMLAKFVDSIRGMRKLWIGQGFNFFAKLLEQFNAQVKSSPESTTLDPSAQPPSQESP
jgi:hypothetical protein